MTTITNTATCNRPNARKTGILARLVAWNRLWIQRQTLKDLDSHMLDDIGVTQKDARTESKRPSWDAPDQWLR